MDVRFQCNRCQEKMALDEEFVGRKVACPMCETRLVVPEPDADPLFVQQDVGLALEYFRLSAWDKAFSRKVLENGFVEADALHQAVTAVRRTMQKGQKLTVDACLLARKAITPQHALIARKLVKALPGSGELAGEALAECPNCFETIRANAAQCPYCGQRTGDLTVSAMCPACKREQAQGRRFCISCGADMKTGLRPGVREKVCPRCGEVEREGALLCRACGTDLDRTATDLARADSARRMKEWLVNHSLSIVAAAVAVVAIAAWTQRSRIGKAVLGPDRAGLEARLKGFDKALRYGDVDVIGGMLDPRLPERKGKADERLRAVILGVTDPTLFVREVKSIEHGDIVFAKGGRSATVPTETRGRIGAGNRPDEKDDGWAGKGEGLSAKLSWNWIERDGEWYYAGPLP